MSLTPNERREVERMIGSGNNSVDQEDWHYVDASGEPAFTNSWVNYSAGYPGARFMKDNMGFVHVSGLIKLGTLSASAFALPAGYRPILLIHFIVLSNSSSGGIRIGTDGTVIPGNPGSNVWFSLDGITFRAEQ